MLSPTSIIMPEEDLVVQLINHPITWVLIFGVLLFVIIREINRGKMAPETKPYWGAKVRKEITQNKVKDTVNTFGIKQKLLLKRGIDKIGIINKVIHITRHGNPKSKSIMIIQYRPFGITSWLKSVIGRWEHMNVQPDIVTTNKRELIIDPNYYIYSDSGIWTLSKKANRDYIEEINFEQDYENVKGFVSDFPRRLSTLRPDQAMFTDRQELDHNLEMAKERSKISRWVKGG